jgi:glycosyltransferase involved in cell wall biosynthesis
MIGNGPQNMEVRTKVKKYGLENNIDLLGFMDGQKKYEIFKQSKMMLHPAIYDSGGMAAAEGMAWGLPGVSFDLLALKTYYPKGMVKTEINNPDKFVQNILKLLDDQVFYDKMSQEAHELIIEVWNWKKRSERILELIIRL